MKATNEFFQSRYPAKYFYKPVAIEIEITTQCNLQCSACGILNDIKKPKTLRAQDIVKFLNKANKGIYAYSIT